MAVLLSVVAIEKSYPTGTGGHLPVLKGASLAVERGEIVAIVGESGTGKSTLLHILGALDRPDAGQVIFEGTDVFTKGDRALARFRNESIGFVFQFHHLLPEFNALGECGHARPDSGAAHGFGPPAGARPSGSGRTG